MREDIEKKSNYEPICVSQDEKEIINDLRSLSFGKVCVFIQNGFVINKEITKTVKNNRHKFNNN